MITIDETKMAMALDAMRRVELQANETITLHEDGASYYVVDATEQRTWAEAQAVLDTLRRRRVILAIVAAVSA